MARDMDTNAAFEDARRRWEQATQRDADTGEQCSSTFSDVPVSDTSAFDTPAPSDIDNTGPSMDSNPSHAEGTAPENTAPFDRASYAQAYREGGIRGWLRHTQSAGDAFSVWIQDEDAQRQFRDKRGHSATKAQRPTRTGGSRVLVVIIIAALVFAVGDLAFDQVKYMRGECVWASWEEFDRHDREYVTKLRCIDVDEPVLQDPHFRGIAKLRGNVPALEQ